MNLTPPPTIWPPAPPPPWAGVPLVSNPPADFHVMESIIGLTLSIVLIAWLTWRSGMIRRYKGDDHKKEMKIRRQLVFSMGEDALWITSAEMEKQLAEKALLTESTNLLIQKLGLLEQKRYGRSTAITELK